MRRQNISEHAQSKMSGFVAGHHAVSQDTPAEKPYLTLTSDFGL